MTDPTDSKLDLFLIVKRGLYYRPEAAGYTGVRDDAGRYTLDEVAAHFPNLDSPNQDGMTYFAEADAPEFSPACAWDAKLKHRTKKAEATEASLRARVAELEGEVERLRGDPTAALERVVLEALPGQREHFVFGSEYYHSLRTIADDADVDKEAARFACKRLRDKGLAQYRSGLFTEDGEVAGAGYALTDAGREAIASLNAEAKP